MTFYARFPPFGMTVILTAMILSLAVDGQALWPGSLPYGAPLLGAVFVSWLVFITPGGPVATTLILGPTHVMGDCLVNDRAIAFNDIAAVEVVSQVMAKRIRIFAKGGEELIEADLRCHQAYEFLRELGKRARTARVQELAVPTRPRSFFGFDVASVIAAAAIVLAIGWPLKPIGFGVGLAIASAWTLRGWSHARALAIGAARACSREDVPRTLLAWYDELHVRELTAVKHVAHARPWIPKL